MPNRLASETSPYLRQHQDNPVDWYPWGEEALSRARAEDKPILLSIGYSACHWCHVMAHESFEDAETAADMNRDFVNIKVDREEHPDVDQIYQHALQIFGENGGWPLTMFLLPTGEPFYGGTYFPPRENYGRPSFRRVLRALAAAYREDRSDVVGQAGKLVAALTQLEGRGAGSAPSGPLPPELVRRIAERLTARMDRREGGFEGAPKFPNPTALSLLFRAAGRSGDSELALPTLLTLSKMAAGGIYDQLGGGFARYSTDAHWLVPHFEKMLYDNGQLLRLLAEGNRILLARAAAGQAEAASLAATFARVVAETVTWLEREMRDRDGGLYAAQDADSEGVEGKYFVWTEAQVAAALGDLGDSAVRLVCRCLDVRPGGNWRDPHGHAPEGASILHIVAEPDGAAEAELLAQAKRRLLAARHERIPPGTDDKVLTAWNGLAIGGLAEAGRLLGEPAYVAAARRTADFLLSRMRDRDGNLLRTYKLGIAKLPATLDDHAFLAEGLFFLASASSDLRYLVAARELTDAALSRFYDPERQVFYAGPAETGVLRLPTRPVSLYDSAIPSGLSVMCMNLLRLAALYDGERRQRYQAVAERMLLRHAEQAQKNPLGLSNLVAALDLLQHGLTTTVIVDPGLAQASPAPSAEARALLAASAQHVPDAFVLLCAPWIEIEGGTGNVPHAAAPLPDGLDGLRQGKTARAGTGGDAGVGGRPRATAYVCVGTRCTPPITSPAELQAALKNPQITSQPPGAAAILVES